MTEDKLLVAIEKTYKFLKKNCPNIKKIGFLGPLGTYQTNLLENYFAKMGKYELIYPDEEGKNNSYDAIYSLEYGIKTLSNPITRKAKRIFKEEVDKFIQSGVKCIILGCTSIYLALMQEEYCTKALLIDSSSNFSKC